MDTACIYLIKMALNLRKIYSQGENAWQFKNLKGISTYLNDNEVLIADTWNNRIQHVDVQTGTFVKSFAAKGEFCVPVDDCLIQVVQREGETISIFGDSGTQKLNSTTSCLPYKNMFLVSDAGNHCIKVYDESGTFLYKFGTQGNQDGQFNSPWGMLDRFNYLLVCDGGNNRVQQFTLDGRFTGKTVTHLPHPVGIATALDGRILVTSKDANKVYILKKMIHPPVCVVCTHLLT